MKIITKNIAVLGLLSLGLLSSCNSSTNPSAEAEYSCPMDCESGKTYTHEGQCPVCGMDLKPIKN